MSAPAARRDVVLTVLRRVGGGVTVPELIYKTGFAESEGRRRVVRAGGAGARGAVVMDRRQGLGMSVTSLTARRLGRDSAEAWLSKRDLARTLGFSARWVERRVAEGMPCERFGARLRFQRGPCEAWLRDQGRAA